jgi:hypothetical protein
MDSDVTVESFMRQAVKCSQRKARFNSLPAQGSKKQKLQPVSNDWILERGHVTGSHVNQIQIPGNLSEKVEVTTGYLV